MPANIKPVVLLILDGWGVASPSRGNAITLARTPVFNKLVNTYPTFTLQAGGESVGLPWGEIGNSEVGHLTLGAGKILYQDLPRINKSIADRSFFSNKILLDVYEQVKKNDSQLHLMGMVSPGGVHSYHEHLYALAELAKEQGIRKLFVHTILDGRDTPFNSGLGFIEELEKNLAQLGVGKIASVSGRYYAMDRDNRWDRTQKYYLAITSGQGEQADTAAAAVKGYYDKKIYDEEIPPTVINQNGQHVALIQNGDSVVFFNFRADRSRQITQSLVVSNFKKFERPSKLQLTFATMTEYEHGLPVKVVFPQEIIDNPIAKVIADAGLKQLHLAETEKYAHVTYFFNGGREQAFANEDHLLVPSPSVTSYDQKPAMAGREIARKLIGALREESYNFYVVNFANADMVGHTGNLPATIKAVEFLDEILGQVVAAVLEVNGTLLITADHGNAEGLINLQTGTIDKEHSATPVPLIVVSSDLDQKVAVNSVVTDDLSQIQPAGVLADIAPTILKIMNIPKPKEMSGLSLL